MSTPLARGQLSRSNRPAELIGNALAVLSFALSLVFPAMLAISDAWIAIYLVQHPFPGPFPWAAFVYNASDYVGFPAIVAALALGFAAQPFNPPWRRMATLALRIGAASLLFLAAVLALLLTLQAVLASGH